MYEKNDSDIKDVWKQLFMTKGHERMQKRSGWEMLSKDLEEMSVGCKSQKRTD